MPCFRLDLADDGSIIDIEADDFDDGGEWISIYNYAPPDADPLDPDTTKDVIASFQRSSLVGPSDPVNGLATGQAGERGPDPALRRSV